MKSIPQKQKVIFSSTRCFNVVADHQHAIAGHKSYLLMSKNLQLKGRGFEATANSTDRLGCIFLVALPTEQY